MPIIQPFHALRPAPGRAAEVLAPPYDVLTSDEARSRAEGRPWSFLHISKPEIDLDPTIDPYDPRVYAKAAENLGHMISEGVLIRDARPSYYVYRLTWGERRETGLAAVASLSDYATTRIRKHEHTSPAKEDDRVRQIEAIGAQTGPVMIGYPDAPAIDARLAELAAGSPEVDVTTDDNVRHQLWPVTDDTQVAWLTTAFDSLAAVYIADGHHRSAAAARVGASRGGARGSDSFLAVLFPHHEMTILDYNRVIRDLNKMTPGELLARLDKDFQIEAAAVPVRPVQAHEFGMFMAGRWYRLTARRDLVDGSDPLRRLPVTVLTKLIIEPVFGITDPRTDARIDFVGGGRGLTELERRVSSGDMAVAFALHPTLMSDIMAVADAGGIMPPKSTWFEPKLADGMVSHVLD